MPRLYAQRDDSAEPRGWRGAAAACCGLAVALGYRDCLDWAPAPR